MLWKIKRFFRWIKKSIQYSKLLWNDEDWDFTHILQLLEYKLKRTRDCIVENNVIDGVNRVKKQIDYALFLLDKIKEDGYYLKEERGKQEELYGNLIFKTIPSENPGFTATTMVYAKCETEEQTEAAYTAMRVIYLKELEMYKDYKRRFYRHLERYLDRWWD